MVASPQVAVGNRQSAENPDIGHEFSILVNCLGEPRQENDWPYMVLELHFPANTILRSRERDSNPAAFKDAFKVCEEIDMAVAAAADAGPSQVLFWCEQGKHRSAVACATYVLFKDYRRIRAVGGIDAVKAEMRRLRPCIQFPLSATGSSSSRAPTFPDPNEWLKAWQGWLEAQGR